MNNNAYTYGTCRHCGQSVTLDFARDTQYAADNAAESLCDCPQAKIEQRVEQRVIEAKNRIRDLFGAEAKTLGFRPIEEPEPIELLDTISELTARGFVSSAAVKIRGYCQAKISNTAKGKIKIERVESRSYNLEVEE